MRKSLLLLSALMGGIPMLAAFALHSRFGRRERHHRRLACGADQAERAARQRDPVAGRGRRYPGRGQRRYPWTAGNQLVRTRHAYAARGLAVLVADAGTDLKSAVDYMAAIKRPVTVIGTSRGTLRAAEGIARGARPDALVLTSGFLSPDSGSGSNVMSILGSPAALPRTLVIHHRQDSCRATLPAGVDPFIKWSAGRARVSWLTGGVEEGDPCQARGHHGFNGLDGQVVALAAGFR